MTDKKAELKAAIGRKLDEIAQKTGEMKSRVSDGDGDIGDDTRDLDRLVRELKALIGQSAFDKTTYQREYMRKKRADNPNYRPIIESIKSMPDWRKPPRE
jgi:hypothetical protein